MARRALVLTFSFLVLLTLFATPSALADPGDLDPNWSADGRQQTSYGTLTDEANSIAIQADQRVIAAGATNVELAGPDAARKQGRERRMRTSGGPGASGGPSCDWAVVRYREDGVLDNTYGPTNNGKVRFGTEECDIASDVVIDANGNAVVVGFMGDDAAIARLTPTGTLDPTFNPAGTTPGIKTFELDEFATFRAVVIDPDGRILVAGFACCNGNNLIGLVARLEPDGDLDPTFNSAGTTPGMYFFSEAYPDDETVALDLVRQPNGSIVAVGHLRLGEPLAQGCPSCEEAWLVLRLTDAGVLDGTFNPGGTPPGTRLLFAYNDDAAASAVALQGNKIVVVGDFDQLSIESQGPPSSEFFSPVVRLNANGSNDGAFANGGVKFIDAGPDGQILEDVLVQADRKIVIVGTEGMFSDGPPEEIDMLVVRLTKDSGAYDSTYHGDGRVTVDFGAFDWGEHGALKLDGNLLIAGYAQAFGFGDNGGPDDRSNIAVARLHGDPKGLDCTVSGTPGNDVLSGSAGPDVICGGAGNDTLKGFKGNDILRGGQGNDTVDGGLGVDYILGYAGNDQLNAADGTAGDVVEGDSGTDTCTTDPGDIVINC